MKFIDSNILLEILDWKFMLLPLLVKNYYIFSINSANLENMLSKGYAKRANIKRLLQTELHSSQLFEYK